MTKRYISRHIDIDQWSLKRILQHVEELKLDLDQVTISKKTEYEYDSEYQVPCLEYRELETDEEYIKRIDEELKYKQSAQDRQRAEYERLKKIYG
jgi:hypothetical protein